MITTYLNKTSLLVFVGFSLLTFSCSDDAMLVGKDILPQQYNLIPTSVDVAGIEAVNTKRDALKSDHVITSILGYFEDPVFGKTKGEFVGQIYKGGAIGINRFNLPSNRLVSLELCLAHGYGNWYGNPSTKLEVKVYEVTTLFPNKASDVYYSDMDMTGHYNPTPIAVDTLVANSVDAATWKAGYNIDTLKIKLSNELAQRFYNTVDSAMLKDNSKFLDFFKGIYIKTSTEVIEGSSMGSIIAYTVNGPNLGLKLTYMNIGSSNDTTYHKHIFPITRDVLNFNKYEHELSSSIDFENPQTDNLYAQGMAGSFVKVTLPEDYLCRYGDSLKNTNPGERLSFSNVSLELFVDTAKSQISTFTPPDSLWIYRLNDYDSNDINSNLSDDKIERPYYYTHSSSTDSTKYEGVTGGAYDKTTYSYKFTVQNAFFERVVTRDDTKSKGERKGSGNDDDFKELYVGPNNPLQNYKRVVVYGQHGAVDKRGVVMKIRTVRY